MTTETLQPQGSFLKKNLFLGVTTATVLVAVIMIFSLGLHLYNIEAIGDANAYYTAAVKSMLQSWHNFFFAAAEPGGSVTVDKPPLGLWIEAVFAYFLGVSGFSVSLPNIIAGILGIPLLYSMVKKYAGELAGLVAALVMAVTPVFVATNRNNTMDGMLVFFLLMAAWAFIRATESGKLRWLLIGAFIVGLGFNIKMMQAFLPLPAFYALYFFGSKEGWLHKVINLGIASVLLLMVSLSWAVVVDLTPADQRPYIGSSTDNTVMELIIGHNGTSRLFGGFHGPKIDGLNNTGPQNGQAPAQGNQPPLSGPQNGQTTTQGSQPQLGAPNGQAQTAPRNGPPQEALTACASQSQGASCSFNMPNGNTINGTCTLAPHASAGVTPLNHNQLVCAPQGLNPQNGQVPVQGNQLSPQSGQTTQGFQPQLGAPNGQAQTAPHNGPPQEALTACASQSQGASCSFNLPNGNTINGTCITPPNQSQLVCAPQGLNPQNGQGPIGGPNGQGGGTPFSQETGSPGIFRFFDKPLSKQMSWLLPFALISVALALFGGRVRLPLESTVHKALLIWGGWLLTCVVFFSMISGIFHSYYAIMLAPALGAMVGIGFSLLWSWGRDNIWVGILLVISAAVTLAFQVFATYQYGEKSLWMLLAGILFIAGSLLMVNAKMRRIAYVTLLASMLVIPMYWTAMTTASNPNINLPSAYQGSNQQAGPNGARPRQPNGQPGSNVNEKLLAYLEANTQDVKYLVAVPSSQQGSALVLATGRPVLYMGGFGGQDNVVSADDLSAMVKNSELRYVLFGSGQGNKQDIQNWLQTSCSVVPEFSQVSDGGPQPQQGPNGQQGSQIQGGGPQGPGGALTLYLCK